MRPFTKRLPEKKKYNITLRFLYHMHEWSSMRQRKPYGRAYDHKLDGPNASGNKKAEPFFIPKAYLDILPALSETLPLAR